MPAPDPNFEPDADATPGAAPSDAELAQLELALARALGGASDAPEGGALEAFGDPRPQAATPARPSFRSSLRASFVFGRFEGDGAAPAVVTRALDAAPVPMASDAFRAGLRARFLAARTDELPEPVASMLRVDDELEVPPARGRGPVGAVRRRPAAGGERATPASATSARRWQRFGAVAAVAAALLAVVLLLRGPLAGQRGQTGWHGIAHGQAFGARELEGLLVDGAPIADGAALAARLATGAALESGSNGLRFAVGREVVIDLGPGTRVKVPRYTPGGGLTFELERGALRIATGAEFQPPGGGRRLAVVTPHLEALAVGTVFGVDCTPQLTCVCCYAGTASTRSLLAGGEEGRVAAGRSRVVFVDGRTLEHPIVPEHRAPLVALSEAWRT